MYSEETIDRFMLNVDVDKDYQCWLWTGKTQFGYGYFCLHVGDEGSGLSSYKRMSHRVAIEMKIGRFLTEGEHALHLCDNRACVNPKHLYVGNQSENLLDRYERGSQLDHTDKPRRTKIKIAHAKLLFLQGRSVDEVQAITGLECSIIKNIM